MTGVAIRPTPGARVAAVAAGFVLAQTGCARVELDAIQDGTARDPCELQVASATCLQDTRNGCHWEPNPSPCRSDQASCPPGTCRGGDPFVRRSGANLLLHGRPFRFLGVGSWVLAQPAGCAEGPGAHLTAWRQRTLDELAAMHAGVLRLYAFQSTAGASGTDFAALDEIVAMARRAGVRVLFILENHNGECSQGGARTDAWYAGGYRQPDGNYPLSYLDYVSRIATHFREEPAVLGYTLVHTLAVNDPAILQAFVTDAGTTIKGADPNHLLTVGVNHFAPGASTTGSPSPFEQLQSLPVVDIVDISDYGDADPNWVAGLDGMQPLLLSLGKPLLVSEAAFRTASVTPTALTDRAERVRVRIGQWRQQGYVGALLWNYWPDWISPTEAFDSRAEDPLGGTQGVLATTPW